MYKIIYGLLICSLVGLSVGTVQEFRLYSKLDQQGDAVTLTGKYENLPEYWNAFIRENSLNGSTKNFSYCQKGWVTFYIEPAFNQRGAMWGHSWSETEYCSNMMIGIDEFKSFRVMGPQDTATPAIALYETVAKGSREHLVQDTAASNNFPFEAQGYVTFGFSNWTLFDGTNYDGNHTCIRSDNLVQSGSYTPFPVRSVIRGCFDKDGKLTL